MLNKDNFNLNDPIQLAEVMKEIYPGYDSLSSSWTTEHKLRHIFKKFCQDQHIEGIYALWNLKTVFISGIITFEYKEMLLDAMKYGHLVLLDTLFNLEIAAISRAKIFTSDESLIFRTAAAKGYVDILNKIIKDLDSEKVQEMIRSRNYEVFEHAATKGNVYILKLLLKHISDKKEYKHIIKSQQGKHLISATKNGHFDVIKEFLDFADTTKLKKFILYKVFTIAAENGDLSIIKNLLKINNDNLDQEKLLHSHENAAFKIAARNGHINVLELFIKSTLKPIKRDRMIHADNDYAFRFAAKNGHIEVLELLLESTKDPVKRNKMIHADNDYAFREATKNGHSKVLEFLIKSIPEEKEKKEIIVTDSSVLNTFSGVLPKLLTILTPECKISVRQKKGPHGIKGILKSNEFITKLKEVHNDFPNMYINTIFYMEKFATKILNLVLTSKTINKLLPQPAMDNILCYLDNPKSELIEQDRKTVFNAMTTITNGSQSKKLSFVDKILKEKYSNSSKQLIIN